MTNLHHRPFLGCSGMQGRQAAVCFTEEKFCSESTNSAFGNESLCFSRNDQYSDIRPEPASSIDVMSHISWRKRPHSFPQEEKDVA